MGGRRKKKRRKRFRLLRCVFFGRSPCGDYFFCVGFLVPFFAAGPFLAAPFLSASLPPIRVNESAALNGYCRTDVSVWPPVFKVISTLRLLAHLMTWVLRRNLAFSSGVISGFCSTADFTSSAVRLCCLPKALVSRSASGTPSSTRKLLTRATRRAERA